VAAPAAVDWLTRLEDALAGVDGSSGALVSAVTRALASVIPIVRDAPADEATRARWLSVLGARFTPDLQLAKSSSSASSDALAISLQISGVRVAGVERGLVHELLGERWGALCVTTALASAWADRLLPSVRRAWGEDGAYVPGALACLSALLAAARYDELLALLAMRSIACWPERQFGVKALAGKGAVDEAICYAGASNPLGHDHSRAIAIVCEHILLSAGRRGRAYKEFAFAARRRQNCLQTFKALATAYPEHDASTILADLIGASEGEEGLWFATARSLRFFQLAAEIAAMAPCDPRTLNRAANERLDTDPRYALTLGMSSLRWIIAGHGVEIGAKDVLNAYDVVVQAGHRLGRRVEPGTLLHDDILRLCSAAAPAAAWVRELLASELR
jgi:hypothetical protein